MKLGMIDYYLDEFHANKYPAWIKEASGGEIEAVYAYAKIDSPKGGQTTDQWCNANNIQRINTIEQVIELSDGLIVLSPDNPEQHEELCDKPLKSGKPVYVDKTFAPSKEIAKKLFTIAQKSGTPCYSSSALRYATEYQGFDYNEIENITSWGPGSLESYTIHQIEPIIAMAGPDIRKVMFTGTSRHAAYICQYGDGRRVFVSHHGWECPFTIAVNLKDESTKILKAESDFFQPFIYELVDFFRTGTIKVPHEQTIAVIAVIEAAIKASKEPEKWIAV